MCAANYNRRFMIGGIPVKVLLFAACLGAFVGASSALGLLRSIISEERESGQSDGFRPAESLRGILYLEKSHRLALHWENGDFELWDTESGSRLGQAERLHRRVGWCIASPDEATVLTADHMVDLFNSADRALLGKPFTPSIVVWDANSGKRKHSIRVPEAAGYPYYTQQWYGQWLDNSHVLVVRLSRENPSRAACRLRLIVIDAAAGRVAKASEDFPFAGEHLFLSPDRTMALFKDDNYYRRAKDGKGVEGIFRNIYARTHVFDLESLDLVRAWAEPPDRPGGDQGNALLARWCPDGTNVVTVSDGWADDHPAPKARLWNVRTGRLAQTFSGHVNDILDIALTSTGDKLLTASEDRTIRVWVTRTGKLEAVLAGHAAGLNKVVVLPGDKLAVSAAEEPVAKVWDLATGKLKYDLPGHDSAVRDVEAVSDKIARTVTLRGTVTTWDCSSGKRLRVTTELPPYPKHFGVCELAEEGGKLHMRVRTGEFEGGIVNSCG